jgi:HlyD family secretion protein
MKKIVIAIIIAVLIGGGLLAYYKVKDGEVKYKTVAIQNGSLRATVTATGTVNAVKTVLVGTQVSGTLKELHVDYNSRVKKGQIIAEIDPATLQAQVDQARANMLAAKANVEKAKAALEDAKRTRDRNRQLFSKNLIARSDLDSSEATHDSNNAQVSAAMAQVAQTEAALRFAETNLGYTKIVSPVDGIVVSRSVDVGQTVAASFQTPTLFTIAQDLTKMQIDTNIDEADIGKIKTAQDVEFTVDAYPDNTFHGIVDEIRIAPITVQNVVTYDVVVKVDNRDLKLKPGMTANVSVIVANKDGVLKIPNAALRFKPSEKEVPAAKTASVGRPGTGSSEPQGNMAPRSSVPQRGDGQAPMKTNKEGVRPSGTQDKASADSSDSDRPRRRFPSQEGKDGVKRSGPSDKTDAALSDSDRPRRRFTTPEGKDGVRPPKPSDTAVARPSTADKSDGRPSTPAGRGTTQSAPRRYAIWILEKDKPKRVMVTTGISDGSFTEITSGDVAEGQEVITGSANTNKNSSNTPASGRPPRFF